MSTNITTFHTHNNGHLQLQIYRKNITTSHTHNYGHLQLQLPYHAHPVATTKHSHTNVTITV